MDASTGELTALLDCEKIRDSIERRDSAWRIVVRTNVIEWSGMVPTMPLPFADVPDIHGNGAPSRSKADPSDQRPLVNRREIAIHWTTRRLHCGHASRKVPIRN